MCGLGKPRPWPKDSAAWIWAPESCATWRSNWEQVCVRAKAQDLVERPADVRAACVPGAPRGFQGRRWAVWKEAAVAGARAGVQS